MSAKIVSKVIEPAEFFLTPLVKTNKLAVAHFEKMVALQMDALQFYMDMGLDRLKAAAKIDDPESLQDFCSGQFEAVMMMARKMIDDAKTLAELSVDFQADFNKQMEKNVGELTDKAAKVTQHVADKTAKVTKETTDKAARETTETVHKMA